jgi:hypothetical protein
MTRMAIVVLRQLQLPLNNRVICPHPAEHVRRELIEALADLLREALGTEPSELSDQMEVGDEPEDHA